MVTVLVPPVPDAVTPAPTKLIAVAELVRAEPSSWTIRVEPPPPPPDTPKGFSERILTLTSSPTVAPLVKVSVVPLTV